MLFVVLKSMEVDELILTALDHENEPPRVPTFVQGIMPKFFENWENKFGDDLEDEYIILTQTKDITLHVHLGFDSSWAGFNGPRRLVPENFEDFFQKQQKTRITPGLIKEGYHLSQTGGLYKTVDLNGYPHSFLVNGVIKTEEEWNSWFSDFNWEIKEPPNDPIKIFNQSYNKAKSGKHPHLLIPSCGLLMEPLIGMIDMGRIVYFARRKPSFFRKILDFIFEPQWQKFKLMCESDAAVLIVPDDCAYKGRPILSPNLYKEFIIPYWKKIIDLAHKHGKIVIMHSDGFVQPYYDDLIEAGLDAHQSVEPLAGNYLSEVKEKWGEKLAFIGNIDCSQLLPFGTKEEVIKTTKETLKAGMPNSGYMFSPCTDLTNSCKVENVVVMMETVNKFGKYPMNIP